MGLRLRRVMVRLVGDGEGQKEVFRTCCWRAGEKHCRPTPRVGEAPHPGVVMEGTMVRCSGSV